MVYDLDQEEDRFLHVLDQFCKAISEGKELCPSAGVLTAALRSAFPQCYIPQGMGIAIYGGTKARWYAEANVEMLPSWRPDVYWLRRRLMRLIDVKGS